MFTIYGTTDSVAYVVGVHEEDMGGPYRHVMGSDNATALLAAHEGDEAKMTPTSDPVTLSLDDPVSILAYLTEHTNVISVEGDVPATDDAADPAARY